MSLRSLVLLFLLAGTLPVQAQELRYGFKLGITAAEQFIGGEQGILVGGGLSAGLFAVLPVNSVLDGMASVDYYQKGGDLDYASLLVATQYEIELGTRKAGLYGFVGPRIDLLVADTVDRSDPAVNATAGPVSFVDAQTVVFGVSAGTGLELTNSVVGPLLLELRYDRDVTPARRFAYGDQIFRTLSLRLGLSF